MQWTATVLLDEQPDARTVSPDAIWFLLHACIEHGVMRARDHVEAGLTCALDAVDHEPDACRRIAWVELLADASAVADDERLVQSVQRSLAPAIDALEIAVRRTYEPGEGLLDQTCAEHLRSANALLTAFQLCGRLPYAMLAEELVQSARRRWWNADAAAFAAGRHDSADAAFEANCLAAQALCRIAVLHADPEYRAAAVLAPHASYADDARMILTALSATAADHPAQAALFGRALLAWFALEPNLQ